MFRAVWAIALGLTCAACSSSTSPSGGGSGSSTASACRTYSTSDRMTFTSSTGTSGTVTKTCDFNRTSIEFACTVNYSDNRGLAYTTLTTFKFASIADFVGDAPRIVLLASTDFHPMSVIATVTTPGLQSTSTLTYTYDSQKHLMRIATVNNLGGAQNQTVTQWDSFGRPTTTTIDSGALNYAYNDTARTATITNAAGGVITQTFDANGIQIAQTSVTPTATETQSWTINSTAQVCK
jgi:YD repeat-containing protein